MTRNPNRGRWDRWKAPPKMKRAMRDVARELRKNPTPSEAIIWQAIRHRQLDGRRFRRQVAIGPFVLDFYCPSERLTVEVDGVVHQEQQQADRVRQELIESLGIRFVRVTAEQVEKDLPHALEAIRAAFAPHPGASRRPSPTHRASHGRREGENRCWSLPSLGDRRSHGGRESNQIPGVGRLQGWG